MLGTDPFVPVPQFSENYTKSHALSHARDTGNADRFVQLRGDSLPNSGRSHRVTDNSQPSHGHADIYGNRAYRNADSGSHEHKHKSTCYCCKHRFC